MLTSLVFLFVFFFNDTATTEIYTLSLHDALPISEDGRVEPAPRRLDREELPQPGPAVPRPDPGGHARPGPRRREDRKSTRLNSSHANISYAVFCLKKKKKTSAVFYLIASG